MGSSWDGFHCRPTQTVLSPGDPKRQVTTQLGYDGFGNLVHVTTPPNHAGQVQTFSVGNDDATRTYPTTTTDGFGYTSRATYDLRFGVATSEVDVNGAEVRRTLDPFGRLATLHGPYDTASQPSVMLFTLMGLYLVSVPFEYLWKLTKRGSQLPEETPQEKQVRIRPWVEQ